VTSDFRPKVEIQPFRVCAIHPTIIIGTVRSLWTWLWEQILRFTERISSTSRFQILLRFEAGRFYGDKDRKTDDKFRTI